MGEVDGGRRTKDEGPRAKEKNPNSQNPNPKGQGAAPTTSDQPPTTSNQQPATSHQPPVTRPLIVIVGPTAVGKTKIAIALAEALNAEIVSADSRYLYRGMDIGTAKPSPEERARVPHHLIDVTTPDQPWTLTQFQSAALEAIDSIHARGKLPLLVGGTGQYIRAITEGWQVPPGDPSSELRVELEAEFTQKGVAALAARLAEVDPASAARVDLRNPRRVIRALEVALTTGESFIAQRRKTDAPYAVTTIGLTLPRPELYARIDARVEAMLRLGLVAEVKALVQQGYSWNLPAMSALGYKQIGQYLRGECDLPEAARRIKSETRKFVRRQANWFKPSDPKIKWFEVGRVGLDEILKAIRDA